MLRVKIWCLALGLMFAPAPCNAAPCPVMSTTQYIDKLDNIRLTLESIAFAGKLDHVLSKQQLARVRDDLDFLDMSVQCFRKQMTEEWAKQLSPTVAPQWEAIPLPTARPTMP